MCGQIAMLLANAGAVVAPELYDALNLLQHRGQDAAGVITCKKGRLYQVKGNGLVRDVFTQRHMAQLLGDMGVGHVRYPTAGSSSASEAQPFYVNSPYGLVLAHNGNLTNPEELKEYLETLVHRHINTDSDSEMLLNILANNLQEVGKARINEDDFFNALDGVFRRCRGGYACVGMITGYGIFGFRDPNGIRPLIYGRRETTDGVDFAIASESVALEALGFTPVRDVQPGEGVLITRDGGRLHTRKTAGIKTNFAPCIFEYVYFARPDSTIDGISVYQARVEMGRLLARQLAQRSPQLQLDVIVPVPDTSRTAAVEMASVLNLPYREGFIKNRYIGRTFIMPGQTMRKKAVRRKLNVMKSEFMGKNVIIVDDSIVRGTTSREIIIMAREAGAKKVYFASCSPPIRFPNVYGIDMPSADELVAHNRTERQVAQEIGADDVIYLSLEDLIQSCRSLNDVITRFDCSVFTGEYVTGDITPEYLANLHAQRSDKAKNTSAGNGDAEVVGLHNFSPV